MRINKFSQSGTQNGMGQQGLNATLTGPLTLAGNPTGPLEATPKQYVDSAINSLNAINIKTGTLSVARLPAFTGDVASATGSGNFVLNNTGVAVGTYTKVTVDSKGRVLSGSNLTNDDIPPFNFSKIGAGKPNTIDGYGITDALKTGGSTVTGTLSLNLDPTNGLHAANKQYVDALGGNGVPVTTGMTIRRPVSTTPSGFLRCNGGQVSKTTYAALYATIGDEFTNTTQPGNGQPWRQQYNFNNVQTNDITGWTTGTSLPVNMVSVQAVVTKNRVYLIGISGSGVYTAPINADGTLGAWAAGTSLPGSLYNTQAIVTKDRVYLLGGLTSTAVTTVYTAPINADGTLGAWVTGNPLPAGLYNSTVIVTGKRVYLAGGSDDTNTVSTVYSAPINTDGTIGTWSVENPLPDPFRFAQAIVTKNRVYIFYTTTIYTAPINADGTLGTWVKNAAAIPNGPEQSQVIATKNRVYLLGGYYTTTVATVYTAPINADGTLGAWTTGTSLPGVLKESQAIVTSSRVYLLGGRNASATNVVYTAAFAGGINDYSAYYNGTITPTDSSNFNLPDLTLSETSSEFFFIKT